MDRNDRKNMNMQVRNTFRTFVGVCLSLAVSSLHNAVSLPCSLADESARAASRPRLALCASGGEKAEAIAALIEVELSQRDDVVLLDREHVNEVLAEHQLQLKGLLSAEDALKVGQLLKCDVLAELHHDEATSENADVACLVAFDSLTGVRLYDGALPVQGDLDERAAVASKALAMGLAKWQGGGTVPNCRTLSFVSIRQLDLPEDMSHASRTMGLLLERRLVNSPDVAILERERLDLIKKESGLTGLRRDRLLASSVLVDLDLLRGQQPDSLQASAVLTDGAGKTIGTLHAVGRVENLGGLVNDLAEAIFDKLKLTSTEGPTVVPGVEADRFLAEALRLELRGRKDEAAVSEKAATMLAEAALASTPWNVRVQKVICRLLRRQTTRASNADKALALLEQQIEYSDRWDYGEDTHWFTSGFARQLHQTLKRLGPGANAERVRQLRDRFGKWCQRMAEQDPVCVDGLVCVEAWSTSAEQMLEDVGRYLDTLPVGLGLARYSTASDYLPEPHQDYLYRPLHFSPEERKSLLALYEQWGQERAVIPEESGPEASLSRRLGLFRRMQSYVCAAFLVHRFPGEFDDAPTRVENYLHQAAEIVVEDPSLSGRLVDMCDARGAKPPPIYRPLPREAITGEVRWLLEELDGRRIACPALLEYLDEHHADHADHPGAYLEKAWTQLDSPDYVPPHGDVLKPRFPEEFVERVEHTFRSRYGRDLEQVQPAEIEEAELESIERLFEFESVPGISSIESAELAGDWVYLLCLHPNPRSYEMRRVNVQSGAKQSMGEIVTDLAFRARTGNEITVGKSAVHVPTSGGLISFRLDEGEVRAIAADDGLPAPRVTACLEVAGKLYLGCRGSEEGYLVRCNVDGKDVEVLACSGRKEKRSELDDCPPYTIESIVYDEARARLFVVAMFIEQGASSHPWLWACDLKTGKLSNVHGQPYHPLQLRRMPHGRYALHVADMHHVRKATRSLPDGGNLTVTVRAPSLQGARGYALWDPDTFGDSPLEDLKEHVVPLMGNIDPDNLKTRYRLPTFCGPYHVMPGTAGSMALLTERYLVSSGVRRTSFALDPPGERRMKMAQAGFGKQWQLIPRGDVADEVRKLPVLDDEAPFVVRIHEDRIVACTQGGLWLLKPNLPPADTAITGGDAGAGIAREEQDAETRDLAAGEPTGRLVVKAPLGATVSVDGDAGYRVWNDGRLKWNDLPVGEHAIDVEFLGQTFQQAVEISGGQVCSVTATFGEEKARKRTLHLGDGCEMELVWVPKQQAGPKVDPTRFVCEGFWMGKYEVTQEQYQRVMGKNPSAYYGAQHPADSVGLNEARAFCKRLMNQCAGELNGWVVRLPSSLEFRYACAAGSTTRYYSGNTLDDLLRASWYPENCGGATHPVGTKMPNAFCLHDLFGNVAEWTDRSGTYGGSWRSRSRRVTDGVGLRVVVSTPDSERCKDEQGWTYLAYVDPVSVKVGHANFVRYKKRNVKPYVAGPKPHSFKTVLYVHAVSSVKYKLDGKFSEFVTNYGVHENSGGVTRFAVFCDGEQKFRGNRIWCRGGTQWYGIKTPVQIDLSGVDVLELVTYGDDNGSVAGSGGYWLDPKMR